MLAPLDGARGVLHFRYSGGSAEENDVPALTLYLVQGGPSALGKRYVDSKFEVAFSSKFIL